MAPAQPAAHHEIALKTPLQILIVENSADDADMLLGELRRAGFDPTWKRVQTEPDFLAEIKKTPEIILSDYSMPKFNGLRAAQLLHGSGLDIPFILISGTVGEEIAVEAMKCGANDYLLKDRITRLGPAVEQALKQKRLRDERKQVEAAMNLFRTLVDRCSDGIEVVDPETGTFLDVNEAGCQRLGYTREEMLALRVSDVEVAGVNQGEWKKNVEELRSKGFKVIEGRHKRKDGSTFPVEISIRHIKLEREYLIAMVRDITDRKRAEEAIQNQLNELQRWHEAVLGREDRVIALKREVNELLAKQKQPARYTTLSSS